MKTLIALALLLSATVYAASLRVEIEPSLKGRVVSECYPCPGQTVTPTTTPTPTPTAVVPTPRPTATPARKASAWIKVNGVFVLKDPPWPMWKWEGGCES